MKQLTALTLLILIVILGSMAFWIQNRYLELHEYEYHIELVDQNNIRVYNNDTIVIIHPDSLNNFLIKDNE